MTDEKRYAQLGEPAAGWPEYFQPIVCGGCHYEFGLVHDPAKGSLGIGPGFDPDDLLRPRKIYLWGGWDRLPVDGIVSFTERAMHKLGHGAVPGRRRGYDARMDEKVHSPDYDLPAVLRCPICKRRQTLDKDKLNADRVLPDGNYGSDAPPVLKVRLSAAGVCRQRLSDFSGQFLRDTSVALSLPVGPMVVSSLL